MEASRKRVLKAEAQKLDSYWLTMALGLQRGEMP